VPKGPLGLVQGKSRNTLNLTFFYLPRGKYSLGQVPTLGPLARSAVRAEYGVSSIKKNKLKRNYISLKYNFPHFPLNNRHQVTKHLMNEK
jgi:hypothetical protein